MYPSVWSDRDRLHYLLIKHTIHFDHDEMVYATLSCYSTSIHFKQTLICVNPVIFKAIFCYKDDELETEFILKTV